MKPKRQFKSGDHLQLLKTYINFYRNILVLTSSVENKAYLYRYIWLSLLIDTLSNFTQNFYVKFSQNCDILVIMHALICRALVVTWAMQIQVWLTTYFIQHHAVLPIISCPFLLSMSLTMAKRPLK